jgi:hypothetical protein
MYYKKAKKTGLEPDSTAFEPGGLGTRIWSGIRQWKLRALFDRMALISEALDIGTNEKPCDSISQTT